MVHKSARLSLQGARGAVRRRLTGSLRWLHSIARRWTAEAVDDTLGVVLKAKEDLAAIRGLRASELLDRTGARSSTRA